MTLLYALLMQTSVVTVDRDDVVIRESCQVTIAAKAIADANRNGVLQIAGDGITVDFAGATLRGSPAGTDPDTFTGFGIRITGKNVTLRNAKVTGFKGGIYATAADGLTLENCDVSDNFAQRLRSTPAAEDGGDWLWPHKNDENEWLNNYGAGICIEDSKNVTVRNCRARRTQNGLILDRATDSKVYDNDFSFLSGWGLAMWRCERNLISHNAFDFCVRGYSHGVYNRGQDSAGILFFEQNNDNVIVENSCTHGGDGFFAFAGREALGEDWVEAERQRLRKETGKENVEELIKAPPDMLDRYRKRGNRGNFIAENDFSYAPAHGLELTFSFDNVILNNRMVENAICGIWGGYSQFTLIEGNDFEGNGSAGYGLERGGVNIEHGRGNRITGNRFRNNSCGVHLWFDDDGGLGRTPWAIANGTASTENVIAANTFEEDALAMHLRGAGDVRIGENRFVRVKKEMESENATRIERIEYKPAERPKRPETPGQSTPVGARPELRGRDKIIMTEWGPYDWQSPYVQSLGPIGGAHLYRLLGRESLKDARVTGDGVRIESDSKKSPPEIRVLCDKPGRVTPYTLTVKTDSQTIERRETLIAATWDVTVFPSPNDPRENADSWRKAAESGVKFTASSLSLRYGGGGPSELKDVPQNVKDAKLPRERFGTIATTELTVPAGDWQINSESDDGIRVWVDDKLVIDDWTHHAPKKHSADLKLDAERSVKIRVEHFELDGFAVLTVGLEPLPAP